jgi:hypothetical protein
MANTTAATQANTGNQWLRALWLLAAAATLAMAAQPASADETRLMVTARVLKHLRLKVVSQPTSVQVTEADVARGYVEVQSRMQLTVETNSNDGYGVAIANHLSDAFRDTRVTGLGSGDMRFSSESVAMQQAAAGKGMRRETLDLGFRFELAPGTRQGTYPWPVQVGLMPV